MHIHARRTRRAKSHTSPAPAAAPEAPFQAGGMGPRGLRIGITEALERATATDSAPLQRKVGLADSTTVVTSTNREDLGVEEASSLNAMLEDGHKRVFDDARELNDFLNNRTHHIGLVKDKWVRVNPSRFYVFGETHGNSAGTFPDIVKGLRVNRFKYEGYGHVDQLENRELTHTGALTERQQYDKLAQRSTLPSHLENLVFKVMPTLPEVYDFCREARDADEWDEMPGGLRYEERSHGEYKTMERVAHYLAVLITMAQDLAGLNLTDDSAAQAFGEAYRDHSTFFNEMKARKNSDRVYLGDMVNTLANDKIGRLQIFTEAALAWTKEYTSALAEQENDDGLRDIARDMQDVEVNDNEMTEPNSPVNRAREWSMRRALAAAKTTYQMVGMGDDHRAAMERDHHNLADVWAQVVPFITNQGRTSADQFDQFT